MMQSEIQDTVSPLDHDDPRVEAACSAEEKAYRHYGLENTEHFVEIPALGGQIRVVEVGDGPPLVLINGGEGKGLMWLPLLPELTGYTLYVMDRPGGGLSDGIDYTSVSFRRAAETSTSALFDYFDLDAAPVVGNSMGGLWTLRFALAHPDRVSAIGLLGTPALYPGTSAPLPMRLGSLSLLSGFVTEKIMQPDDAADVRKTWSFLGHPDITKDRLPREFAEAWYRMEALPTYKPSWIGILRRALRLRGARPEAALTTRDLESIDSPVCLLWGSDDPFGSLETGRNGAEHFQDATFHEVGVGHLPWLDEPGRCGELLRSFLDRHH